MKSHKNGNALTPEQQRRETAKEWREAIGSIDGVYYMELDHILDAMNDGATLQDLLDFFPDPAPCNNYQGY